MAAAGTCGGCLDRFDVVVVGGGWGGYTAAVRCRRYGFSVALVERDKLGGTCLHRGCIPTKVLLQTAENLDLSRRLDEFGIHTGEALLDYAVVLARKQRVVEQLYGGLQRLVKSSGVELISGTGTLEGPEAVRVVDGGSSRQLSGDNIILATGSRPRPLPGVQTDGRWIVDSDQALLLDHLPRSVIVLGGGAVGTEFASFYRDTGAEVTLVELMPALLPLEDREISTLLARLLGKRDIRILTGAEAVPESVQRVEGGVALNIRTGGEEQRLDAECLLIAAGRQPVTEELGLENVGVELRSGFIPVDGEMRTTAAGLYAVGDVTGNLLLAHVAAAEGTLAADVIAGKPSAAVDYPRLPRATYCRPQVASVGLGEEEARTAGYPVKTGKAYLRVNGKALILGEPEGMVKVIADAATDDLLGLHLIGAGVTEMVAEGALGRFLNASLWEIATTVYPHPTLSEAIGEAAQAARHAPVKL